MSQSEERGKWQLVRDEYRGTFRIPNPSGLEYEFSESDLRNMDRRTLALLNDMLGSLIDLQAENEALRAREAMRDRAEGQSAFDLQAQVEAIKAARSADKAGFDVVIRELREEVARLKGGAK